MESNFARENLSLPTMDKVTVLSIGHGQMTEKSFYELLQLNSVRVLYDFRASDHRGDVKAPCEHFSTRSLKSSCRMRGIAYKHVALGRESAYGILKHVKTDEAWPFQSEKKHDLLKHLAVGMFQLDETGYFAIIIFCEDGSMFWVLPPTNSQELRLIKMSRVFSHVPYAA